MGKAEATPAFDTTLVDRDRIGSQPSNCVPGTRYDIARANPDCATAESRLEMQRFLRRATRRFGRARPASGINSDRLERT